MRTLSGHCFVGEPERQAPPLTSSGRLRSSAFRLFRGRVSVAPLASCQASSWYGHFIISHFENGKLRFFFLFFCGGWGGEKLPLKPMREGKGLEWDVNLRKQSRMGKFEFPQ